MWDQGENVSFDLLSNRPNALLGLDHVPWSGAPNPTWLVGPCHIAQYKEVGVLAARGTRFPIVTLPTDNPNSDL
jgi:hypothetical protein